MREPKTIYNDEKLRNEHNAAAWLVLTDRELIERSASLGLPANLHPPIYTPEGAIGCVGGGVLPTDDQVAKARKNADDVARMLAGDEFVDGWIKQNRS
jgi:hypothetical protein